MLKAFSSTAEKHCDFSLTGYFLILILAMLAPYSIVAQQGWNPPTNMQNNMQVVAKLQLGNGNFSSDSNDIMAAFFGNEVWGVASPTPTLGGLIFLSIASNQLSGEIITFKAWLSTSAQIVDLNETLIFQSQGETGTFNNPFIFTISQGPVAFTIQATAGMGGSISPSGSITVAQGGSQSFVINPSAGYQIQDVIVNGTSVGAVSSFTFSNVKANQTIHAEFSQVTFTITASAGAGGSISPSGVVSVPYLRTQTFIITPTTSYIIAAVLVNGLNVGQVDSYTFNNILSNQQIHAVFTPATSTISSTAGPGGTIMPSGTFTVNHGSNITFVIQPANGFRIDSVVVDNINVGPISTYQLLQISANHTIRAWFGLTTEIKSQENGIYAVYPNPSNGGFILKRGNVLPADWVLKDIYGRIIHYGKVTGRGEEFFSLSVKPGMYNLNLTDENGIKAPIRVVVR